MKLKITPFICLTLFFVGCNFLKAQTLTDAVMMKQREFCLALVYDYGSWDQYWEGSYLRGNGNIGTLKRNSYSSMLAIGVLDRINVIVGAPYVTTKATDGQMAGVEGFQDLTVGVKGEILNRNLGAGKLNVLAAATFSTPLTNYLSDYMPFSLGHGANEFAIRGIAQFKLNNGVYVRAAIAYKWRGLTEAERDYYYNDGSYYTTLMDVPNAWDFNSVAGVNLLKNHLRFELNYTGLRSTDGDDIRPYNAGQPTNKVDIDRIGISGQYYFTRIKGLGVLAYYSKVVNGRNAGKFTNVGAGLTYQFKI